jgi:hypothetical protein
MLAACGGSSTTGGGSSQANSHSTTPTGPPTATASLAGDVSLAGAAKITNIQCGSPGLDGPGIILQGQANGFATNGVGLYITILAHKFVVRAAIGSGATYTQREFDGTGITSFDAVKGTKVNSPVTEDASAGLHPGAVGNVVRFTASVDCANQQPGTANITVTGTLPEGALSGTLASPRVNCASYPQGLTADVVAVTELGGKKALIIIGVTWAGISVATSGHFYVNPDPASGSATATTAH